MKRASDAPRIGSQLRDLSIYLLIAVLLIGTEVIGFFRGWPQPSLRVAGSIFSTLVIAFYLIKIFKAYWRSIPFWILLLAMLSIHVFWTLSAPFLFVMIAMGIELFLFGLLIRYFLSLRNHSGRSGYYEIADSPTLSPQRSPLSQERPHKRIPRPGLR